jgi:hypothetical protein
MTAFVQDMGVDHRRFYIAMAQEFLNGTNIIAGLKQMRGKGVTEGVASGVLDYTRLADGVLDCPL